MKFKEKLNNHEGNHATEKKAAEKNDEKDWFAEQYEKLIGKPLPRRELTTEEVVKKLQDATKYRWIPEAKAYKGSMPENGPAHYFEWNKPEVNKCTCLDNDCTCKGDLMFPRKKIPRGKRYFKSPILQKIMMKFTKSDKAPNSTPNFTERLAELIETEAELYKNLEKKGELQLRGAEFCFSRCIRFYGPGRLRESRYDTDEQKPKVEELQSPEIKENDDSRDRKHDGLAYTVSTPSTVAPCPELGYGMEFREDYDDAPNVAILKDINGTRLHISSIQCAGDEPSNVLLKGYGKLLSLGEGLNMKGLKNKLHQLKQNIYSSIIEIDDNKSTLQSVSTQYDDNVPSNKLLGDKSSEGITIETPYKGVTVKVKKKASTSKYRDNPQLENKNSHFDLSEKIDSAQINKNNINVTHKISVKDMLTKSVMMDKLETKSIMTTTLKQQESIKRKSEVQKMELLDSIVNAVNTNEVVISKSSTRNSLLNPQTDIISKEIPKEAISNTHNTVHDKNDEKSPEEVKQLVTLNKAIHKSFDVTVNGSNDVTRAQYSKQFLKNKYYGFSLDQLHSSKIKRFIKFLRNEKLLSSPDEQSVIESESDKKDSTKKISNKQSYSEELPLNDINVNAQMQLNSDKPGIIKQMSGIEEQGILNKREVMSCLNLPNTTSTINDGSNVKQVKEDSKELQIQSKCYVSNHNIPSSHAKNTEFSKSDNIIEIKENKGHDESKLVNFEISLDRYRNEEIFSKILTDKEEQSDLNDQNIESPNKISESRKQESLYKTLLKLSSQHKRAHPEKKNNLIKSLPEPRQRHFKFDEFDANCGANKIDLKQYQYNKEPKISEKEMFSIQYSYKTVGKNERSKKSLQIT